MDRTRHWDTVFSTKADEDMSWFEPLPDTSLRLLDRAGLNAGTCVVDIGGGDSRLVDRLIARGLRCLAVLDVSGAALAKARSRLGASASIPTWLQTDVTGDWSLRPMDIWHDRAVLHFLTDVRDRGKYRSHLLQVLGPGGAAIIATFGLDGPQTCSGLPVRRSSPEQLAAELGPDLELVESVPHTHVTPWGATQSFVYCRFVRVGLRS